MSIYNICIIINNIITSILHGMFVSFLNYVIHPTFDMQFTA